MAIFKDTIMIKDRPYDRAIQVTVIAPDDVNVLNVQELAEKAWRSVNKEIKIGAVTVKVQGFDQNKAAGYNVAAFKKRSALWLYARLQRRVPFDWETSDVLPEA
jgi:hypothetical protein